MKTKSQKILSVFMSMLIVFMYMTSASVQAVSQKMIFNFNKIEVSAGQDIQFDIVILNPVAIKEVNQAIINIPDGFTVTGMSETSPAFNGTVTYSVSGNYLNFSIASNGTLGNSDVIASIYMHVDENCTAKNYMFQWSTNAVSCILATGNSYTPQFNFGIITVGEGGNVQTTTTTTPAPTTTTTTTTTAKKYTYNVRFVDEETNQAVSGVRYNIVSYDYAHDPAQTVQTSGDNPQSFEFVSDTAYVALVTIENALPDGYITADGATRWELSANNPDLTVYLRKPETTTTKQYTYSINFVDKETNQGISGVKYGISTLGSYTYDSINTSNGERYYFESELNTLSVSLIIDNPIPDGYYVNDTNWNISAENPDLTVYLGKIISKEVNISIKSYPKIAYKIGEAINLSGGQFSYSYKEAHDDDTYITTSNTINMKDSTYVETAEFDSSKEGTYKIYIKFTYKDVYAETYFTVSVSKTGDPIKHNYTVQFVDEETNQAISGVKYGIASYYVYNGIDPALTIQTSGENPQSFEFISYTAFVELKNALPDGYTTSDGAERWELSGDNPDLTVYLRKAETTTTTESTTTTTTETTATTTTIIYEPYAYIRIDNTPDKSEYYTGEQLDLTGLEISYYFNDGQNGDFIYNNVSPMNYLDDFIIDTSAFNSYQAGTYEIKISCTDNLSKKYWYAYPVSFKVNVTEKTETTASGDINNDGFIDSVDASLVLSEYALLSTENGIGEFTPEQNTIADLNKDGEVNASDATLILMYYSYLSTDNQNSKDSIDIWLSYTLD